MKNLPLISVVTPSYSHGEFIESAIRSVLAQDYPNLEYIIIDGGSTDNTSDIVGKYQAENIRFICEPDDGQSDAINKAFRIASGEILAWLNSDDYYYPGAFDKAAKAFADDSELDVLYGDAAFVGENSQFIRYFTEIRDFSPAFMLNHLNYIMQPATFFRREAVEKIGFLREDLHFGLDWDFWCRLIESGAKFRYEPQLFAANRVYPATKTLSGGRKRLAEYVGVSRDHKRGRIPWGGLSHIAGDFVMRLCDNDHDCLPFRFVRFVKRLLKRQNIRCLYGVGIEGSGAFLEKEFCVSVPWYLECPEKLELQFCFHGAGIANLHLQCGDNKINIIAKANQPLNVNIAYPKSGFDHQVELRGQWESDSKSNGRLIMKHMRIK